MSGGRVGVQIIAGALIALTLSGCSASAPSDYPPAADDAPVVSNALDSKLPSTWTASETALFSTLAKVHPEVVEISMDGKTALMTSTPQICAAYSEGASRH